MGLRECVDSDRFRARLAIFVCIGMMAGSVGAQTPGGATSANPSVATQRAFDVERGGPPGAGAPRATSIQAPARPVDKTPTTTGGPRFLVGKIRVEGVTVVTLASIASLVHPIEGRGVTFSELRELTKKIEALYRSRGYFLARADMPRQQFKVGGDLRIVVAEGKYGTTKIEGNRHYSSRFIDRFFAPARRAGLIHLPEIERALLTLNEFSDLTVRCQFTTGKVAGTADPVLTVKDRAPFHVALDYNNYGIPLVGEHRAGTTISGGSAFTEGDDLVLRVVESFPSKSEPLYQGSYTAPVGDRGNRFSFQYTNSRTRVGGNLAIFDIRGAADIYGLTASIPIKRTLAASSTATAGLSIKTIKNFVFGNTITSQDDIRALTFGYSATNTVGKIRWGHTDQVTQGLGTALGGRTNGDPLSSRAGAGNEFTKLTIDPFLLRELSPRHSLLVRASIQLSTDPLPVAELFGIGGPDSVRGFLQSEFLGDEGYNISAEHRWALIQKPRMQLQGFAFIDRGEITLKLPQVGEQGSRRLVGAGVGVRGSVGRTTTFRLEAGFPTSVERNAQGDEVVVYSQVGVRW